MKSVLLVALLALPLVAHADVLVPGETPAQREARIANRQAHRAEFERQAREAHRKWLEDEAKRQEERAQREKVEALIETYITPLFTLFSLGAVGIVLLRMRQAKA